MLPAFLPHWLQDLSDTAAVSKAIELLNGSLLPLLLVLPVVVAALLLMDRSRAAAASSPRVPASDAIDTRLAAPVKNHWMAVPDPAPRPATRPAAALVLIVDDSAVVRGKLSRLLGAAGFRAVAVGDGQQALDFIEAGQLPRVLITDLEMPAVDGFELITALRCTAATECIPVIAITGHDDLQARVVDLGGVYGIFKKPWNDRELIRRVQALAALEQAHPAAA